MSERRVGRSKIIDASTAGTRSGLDVESVSAGIVRLTRRDDGQPVSEVTLFVADSDSRIVASQTLRDPPFTALFDVSPRLAFAGVTVLYVDGVRTTTVVPFAAPR
jgi:hypothetical protein